MFEKGHAHTSCPFLSTQNRLRKAAGVEPIGMERGWVYRSDEPEKEDVEDVIKRLNKEIVDLTAEELAELGYLTDSEPL